MKKTLRRQAERIARGKAAPEPESIKTLSPEEVRSALHELGVHQIELEIQNEELRRVQAQLETAQARYFDLYDLAPVGYCTISEEGLILEANLTAANMLGVARQEPANHLLARFISKDDQDLYFLHRKSLFESGTPQAFELRMVKKDGAMFWAHLTATAAKDTDVAPMSRVVLTDITARKQADAYRDLAREVLQILNEPGDLPDTTQRVIAALKKGTGFDAVGLRLQDGEDFPYFAQDGFPKDFVLTENTLCARDASGGLCRDNDGHVSLECACGLVVSGKTDSPLLPFTPGGSFWTNDSAPLLDLPPWRDPRHHPRNHCVHQGYASFAMVPIRNKNKIVGLLQINDRRKGCFTLETIGLLEGLALHIGAALMRKQGERELQEAKALTEAIVEHIPLMIFLKEATDLRFVTFNRAGEELLGYDRQDLLGKNNLDLFPPEQAAHFMANDREVLASAVGMLDIPEEPILTARNGQRFLHTRKVCIRGGDGTTKYLLGISEDITERKLMQNEVLQISDWEKTRIGQDLHDTLGQHLAGVTYLSQTLAKACRRQSKAETEKDMAQIAAESQRAVELVRYVARGLMPVAPGPNGLVEALGGVVQRTQQIHGVACILQADETLAVTDRQAATHLFFLAQEAVTNAVRHGQARHIVIRLARADGQVELAIQDDGVGLPVDRPAGQGLGLRIMQYRADLIGGTLAIERVESGGTRVVCRFTTGRG